MVTIILNCVIELIIVKKFISLKEGKLQKAISENNSIVKLTETCVNMINEEFTP